MNICVFISIIIIFFKIYVKNTFQNLGHIIAINRSTVSVRTFLILLTAAALIILLFAVFFLHAGLSAKERYLKQEEKQ